MKLNKLEKKKIHNFCIDYYKKQDFAHNINHMKKTVELAKVIGKKENANLGFVEIGAMIHQFHDDLDLLRKNLKKIKIDPNLIEELVACSAFRPFKKRKYKNIKLESKVVFDADVLQCIGPQGIIREISCNLHCRGKLLDKSVKDAKRIETLFRNSLQTKTGKKMAKVSEKLMKEFWKQYDL